VASSLGPKAPARSFGPDRRVRKRRDYQRIQSGARRVTTPHYVLLVARQPAPEADAGGVAVRGRSRLGLIVTRKVGNAVARNRIKRVCRECFRLAPDLIPDGVDLVVVARDGAERLGLREAQAEWASVGGLLKRRALEALAQDGAKAHVSRGPKPRARP
jgi:ribonuclease P protein component